MDKQFTIYSIITVPMENLGHSAVECVVEFKLCFFPQTKWAQHFVSQLLKSIYLAVEISDIYRQVVF